MKHFTILLIFTFLLNGCAKKTPTETIIDDHIDHINQVLDYAHNNIDQTPDVMLLEGELKSCQITLSDVKQSHKLEISSCETRERYHRVAILALLVACIALLWGRIKSIL